MQRWISWYVTATLSASLLGNKLASKWVLRADKRRIGAVQAF